MLERKLEPLGYYAVEKIADDAFKIVKEGLAYKKLSFRDELECWVLKQEIADIEDCSPNFVFFVNSERSPEPPSLDSLSEYQWGNKYIFQDKWPELVESYSGSGIIVAVTDTGVDLNHPDLSPNIFKNEYEIPGNGIDDDGNGYIDDYHGWNGVELSLIHI